MNNNKDDEKRAISNHLICLWCNLKHLKNRIYKGFINLNVIINVSVPYTLAQVRGRVWDQTQAQRL